MFTSEGGTAPIRANNWRRRVFYPALEAAGLPKVPPHALRRRAACDLLDRRFSIDQVAYWLGDTPAGGPGRPGALPCGRSSGGTEALFFDCSDEPA